MQKYRRLIIVGIGLGLGVFILLTLFSDVNQLLTYAQRFPWWVMGLVIGLRMVNWLLRFIKWHFYLWLVGAKDVSVPDSAAIFVTGFTLSASPGKAAEFLKSFILKNLYGVPVATTFPVVAAERLSDGIAVLLLLTVGIANLAVGQYWPVIILGSIPIVAGIIILQIRPLCLWLLNLMRRVPVLGSFARDFERFYESSYKIVRLPNLIVAVGLGTLANLLDGVALFLILTALGQPATGTTYFQALVAHSLMVVAGSVSGSPGGIGASELTMTGALQKLAGMGVAEAGFATIVARFAHLWWGVLVGAVVAFLARKRLFPSSLDQMIAAERPFGVSGTTLAPQPVRIDEG
ncbi:MAG: flippase-like domain-containing protein [Anaerolineae bacterium]|nr:flippase-like domain-containing protein [Anaerolineae bacterium]